jgi:hypothetical protein
VVLIHLLPHLQLAVLLHICGHSMDVVGLLA